MEVGVEGRGMPLLHAGKCTTEAVLACSKPSFPGLPDSGDADTASVVAGQWQCSSEAIPRLFDSVERAPPRTHQQTPVESLRRQRGAGYCSQLTNSHSLPLPMLTGCTCPQTRPDNHSHQATSILFLHQIVSTQLHCVCVLDIWTRNHLEVPTQASVPLRPDRRRPVLPLATPPPTGRRPWDQYPTPPTSANPPLLRHHIPPVSIANGV